MLGFLGFANVYAMRVNLSVTIVAMVNQSAIPHINQTAVDICPETPGNGQSGIVKVNDSTKMSNIIAKSLGDLRLAD